MREKILIKHLNNLIFENPQIKDAFIMGVDGLLIVDINNDEDHQRIAARMAGLIDASKRIEGIMPRTASVIINNQNLLAVPISEKFIIVIVGTINLSVLTALKQVNRNKENIIDLIEKNEFSDLFSYNPVEVNGLD